MGFLLQFLNMLLSGHGEQPFASLYGRIEGLLPHQVVMFIVIALPAMFQELLADGQALVYIEAGCFVGSECRVFFDGHVRCGNSPHTETMNE